MIQNPVIDLRQIIEDVRKFAEKELAPFAEELDREERLAPGVFKRLGDLGILGVTAPKKFGGLSAGAVEIAAICEELSYADPSTCLSYVSHTLSFVHNLCICGSSEQQNRYLPDAISGQTIGGLAITEPSAGSDLLAMQTHAKNQDNYYILNGCKSFITNGPIGDTFLIYAKIGEERKDIGLFIVENSMKGFSVGPRMSKMGMRASPTSEIHLHDCIVPFANRIEYDGDLAKTMLRSMDIERVAMGAISLGIARACLDNSLKYATQREQFGNTIINYSSISDKISNMYISYRAARALVYEAAHVIDEGRRANQEAATAKVFASEMATKTALDAIQILGGYGYTRQFPVERLMRDAKLLEIIGGTSEVLRSVIVKEFLRKRQGNKQ